MKKARGRAKKNPMGSINSDDNVLPIMIITVVLSRSLIPHSSSPSSRSLNLIKRNGKIINNNNVLIKDTNRFDPYKEVRTIAMNDKTDRIEANK